MQRRNRGFRPRITKRPAHTSHHRYRAYSEHHTYAPTSDSASGSPPIRLSRLHLRLHHWYHGLPWPSRAGIIFGCIFAAMTVLPAGVAGVSHHGFAFADTNPEWRATKDAHQTVTVYHTTTGVTESMALNDYILDVMAAEVDPNAPTAALQATAVAVRTYAMHAVDASQAGGGHGGGAGSGGGGTGIAASHGAELSDDANADLPLLTPAAQQRQFGAAYAADRARLATAITSTDGLILTLGGKPILAFITPVSAGETRNGSQELPTHPAYLPSITCPADAKAVGFNQEFRLTKAEVASKLKLSAKTLDLSKLQPSGVDGAGYAKTVNYGTAQWTAGSFAAAFGLPSTHMKFQVDGGVLVIRTEGIGSGYGMSLNQAESQATGGADFKAILARFYPGCALG